jgi:hypothetical protein
MPSGLSGQVLSELAHTRRPQLVGQVDANDDMVDPAVAHNRSADDCDAADIVAGIDGVASLTHHLHFLTPVSK